MKMNRTIAALLGFICSPIAVYFLFRVAEELDGLIGNSLAWYGLPGVLVMMVGHIIFNLNDNRKSPEQFQNAIAFLAALTFSCIAEILLIFHLFGQSR